MRFRDKRQVEEISEQCESEDQSTAQRCYPEIMSGSVVLPGARLCPSDNVHMQGDTNQLCVIGA